MGVYYLYAISLILDDMKFLIWIGLIGMFFEAIEKKHFLGQIIKGVKTRKENGTYIAWNKGITGEYKHSDETKRKMSELRKEKSKGENNPMFGKKVINNGVINKIINKDESLPNGWNYGRLKKS